MRKAQLESADFKVFTAESGSAGLEIVNREPIDVVILDYRMPGMDGGMVAMELRRRCPNVAIILSSGIAEIPDSVLMIMDGVLAKGTSAVDLIKEIERVTTATKPAEPIPHIELDRSADHSRRVSRSGRTRRQQRGG